MCEVLGVSTSGYYGWRKHPLSKRQQENLVLLEEIKVVYERSRKTYGSPRIHRVLKDEGCMVGRNRVANLMRENGIQAIQKRKSKRTTDSLHHRTFATRDEARQEIFDYIEVFYNRQRKHSALDFRSPAEFEMADVA